MATHTASEATPDDHDIDQKIGILLRVGIYLAALVTLVGAALYLARHAGDQTNYGVFRVPDENLRSPVLIVQRAFHGSAVEIMQFGMLLLIATPIARVVFSVVAFAVRKDLLYVVISGIVLAVLAYGVIFH
jgi:uncharacterized membrane protein